MSEKWIRTGTCSQCGECCRIKYPLMVNDNGDACKYLELRDDRLYYCKITDAIFNSDTEKKNEIDKNVYDYWKSQCQPYPNPDDEGHRLPLHELPEKCTFKIVRVI